MRSVIGSPAEGRRFGRWGRAAVAMGTSALAFAGLGAQALPATTP